MRLRMMRRLRNTGRKRSFQARLSQDDDIFLEIPSKIVKFLKYFCNFFNAAFVYNLEVLAS